MTPTVIGIPGIGHELLTAAEQEAMADAWLEAINEGLRDLGASPLPADRFRMIHWGPAMEAIGRPSPRPFGRVKRLVTSRGAQTILAPLLAPIRLAPTALIVTGALLVRQWRRAVSSDAAREQVSQLVRVTDTVELPPDTATRDAPRAVKWATNVPVITDISQWLRMRQVVHYQQHHARRRQMLAGQIEELWNDEPVIIVAHSLGTLVGLQLLLMTPGLPQRTAMFLTLGSPLWLSPLHETVLADLQAEIRVVRARGKTQPPRSITLRNWVNVRDPRDTVAQRVLADIIDENIVEVAIEGCGHDQYALLGAHHTAAALAHGLGSEPARLPVADDRRAAPPATGAALPHAKDGRRRPARAAGSSTTRPNSIGSRRRLGSRHRPGASSDHHQRNRNTQGRGT